MDADPKSTIRPPVVYDARNYPASRLRDIVASNKKSINNFLVCALTNAKAGINKYDYALKLDEFDVNYLRGLGYIIVAQDGFFEVSF